MLVLPPAPHPPQHCLYFYYSYSSGCEVNHFFHKYPLSSWENSLQFLVSWIFLSWKAGFCQMLFLYLDGCFFTCFVLLMGSHWFSYGEPPLLSWDRRLGHGAQSFNTQVFCWKFLHLCSWGILIRSFLVMSLSGFSIRTILASPKRVG